MKREIALVLAFVIFSGIFAGIPVGYFTSNCIHELGHFIFGYVFNPDSIEKFECLKIPEFTFSKVFVAGQVKFKQPVFTLFPPIQATIVLIAGFLFEVILAIGLFYIIHRILKHDVSKLHIYNFAIISFLFGMLVSNASSMSLGWLSDFNEIFLGWNLLVSQRFIILRSMVIIFMLVYFLVLMFYTTKYVRMINRFLRETKQR